VANLPLRPLVAKVFQQFPGDFGAMGQDSIVGQSFILLNAKSVFFSAWPQDSIVLQLYILLIYKKLFFSA